MFISPLSPEQWADVRRRHAAGASFASLAGEVGLKPATISQRARREGWSAPQSAPAAPSAPTALVPVVASDQDTVPSVLVALEPLRRLLAPSLASSPAQMHRALNRRFFRILEMELMLVELCMQKRLKDAQQNKDAPIPSSDEDLRKKTESVMKTASETLELPPDSDAKSRGGNKSGKAGANRPSEADVFRREIAERLEKLIPPE